MNLKPACLSLLLVFAFSIAARADWVQDGGIFNVDPDRNATSPGIAVGNDTPYVVWSEENASGKKQIYVKKNNGITWVHASGSVESLNVNQGESANYPAIEVYNDTPYVVWAEDQGNTRQVYVKYLNGTAWQMVGPGSLNVNADKFADYPAIDMDGATPYVTWREDAVTAYHIFVKQWNGSGWEQVGRELNLNKNISADDPGVAMIGAVPYVTWMEDYKIYVKKYNGLSWESLGGELNINLPSIALSPKISSLNGTPCIAWSESYFGAQRVYVKHFNGSDWQLDGGIINNEPERIAYAGDIKFYASVPYIILHEDTFVSGQFYYIRQNFVKTFDGVSWTQIGSSLNIDANYDAWNPRLSFADNIVYVVWSEESPTNSRIYCKFNVLPTPTSTPTCSHSPTITFTPTVSPTPTITPTCSPTRTHSTTATFTPTLVTPSIAPTNTVSPTVTCSPTLNITDFGGKTALIYPNPARDRVNFLLDLSARAKVEIMIYSISGDLVAKLEENLSAGQGQLLQWSCQATASGVYLAKIVFEGQVTELKKFAILKK